MIWDMVIGLEVHTQLATNTKIFSGASTTYGAEANTQACAIDLALPGTLPVLNKDVVKMAVKFGLAVDAVINKDSVFDRKNYFYPDLPKGYQISQLEIPIVGKGSLEIELENGKTKAVEITRAHLEEDAGKSDHTQFDGMTGVDLNRAGTPLLEIVSEPVLYSAKEAVSYLKTLHKLVRHLGISDGNMQEGSFRCDVNISLKPKGRTEFGTRAEIKNLNSFKFVEKAIHHEYQRQAAILESGGEIVQETRLYDPDNDQTRSMRSKADAHDYRYFPDPDLLPVLFDDAYIEEIRASMPELPQQLQQRFIKQYKLSTEDANILTGSIALSQYFEAVAKISGEPKLTANWVTGELTAYLNKNDLSLETSAISSDDLALLIIRIKDGTISSKIAKTIFESMVQNEGTVDGIIESKGLKQMSDSSEIEKVIDEIIQNNPKQLEQLKAGKTKLFGFFVGQAMKATQGKANPKQLNDILKSKIGV